MRDAPSVSGIFRYWQMRIAKQYCRLSTKRSIKTWRVNDCNLETHIKVKIYSYSRTEDSLSTMFRHSVVFTDAKMRPTIESTDRSQQHSKTCPVWKVLLPPATKLGQGNIFRSVCQQFCPWGGGLCMVARGGMRGFIRGGMHGFIWGACVVLFGRACMVLFSGHAWFYSGGTCVVLFGGHAWFYSAGGMHGFIQQGVHGFIQQGGACMVLFSRGGMRGFFNFSGYNEIRSMSGQYASYWNAFLLFKSISHQCYFYIVYRPKRSAEDNVFSSVCQFVLFSYLYAIAQSYVTWTSPRPVNTCSLGIPTLPPLPLPQLRGPAHYVVHTSIGKRPVDLR